MTSPMPMPYTGVLWWNPPCIQTLVRQLLSRSHATAHKYIWHPRPQCLCSVSLVRLQCSMDPWKCLHLVAGSHFTHQSNPTHLCSMSLARLQHSMDPPCLAAVPCASLALHEPLEMSMPGGRLPLHAPKQPRSLERHDFGHCGLTQKHIYANWWACIHKSWQNHLFLEQYSPCHHPTVPISWRHKS